MYFSNDASNAASPVCRSVFLNEAARGSENRLIQANRSARVGSPARLSLVRRIAGVAGASDGGTTISTDDES
jgi:hypothetical protein